MAKAGDPSTRRGFLAVATHACMAAMSAVVAIPAAFYLLFPVGKRIVQGALGFVPLGPLTTFPDGETTRAEVITERRDAWTRAPKVAVGAVWVARQGAALTVFTSACPHLSCDVEWVADEKKFECPCHDSAYAADGARVAGPAKRGLDVLEHRVSPEGVVEVRYQTFKKDTPDKVEA